MTNLQSDRDTEIVDELRCDEAPVAAGANLFNGGAVALDAGGFAVPAGPGPKHFRGIADESVDNSAGGNGDVTVHVIAPDGAYFDGTGFGQGDVGQPAWFSDDHTVTKSAGTNTYAGRIRSVDSAGILVDLRGAYVEPALPVTSAPTTGA